MACIPSIGGRVSHRASFASGPDRLLPRAFFFAVTVAVSVGCFAPAVLFGEQPSLEIAGKRIMFLGDSNTHAGDYIVGLESQLRWQLKQPPELINLGLPSETCCGLSEPDHPFPRPNVQERAERAFDLAKPDIVAICYGMNDGIYHPFDQQRFEAYQTGIRRLIGLAKKRDVQVVLMTPPPFDALPMRKTGKLRAKDADAFAWFGIYENYDDEVIKKYAAWILEQHDVELVIDLYTPMNEFLANRRKTDEDFAMSNDGVHFNAEGHQLLTQLILTAWGVDVEGQPNSDFNKLVQARQKVLHESWLTHVGHQRPGMKPGLPMAQATMVATQLDKQIAAARK